uniref:UPAR/Ly6 domain-containing protein n=1 Tax=Xiphophorus maculatus TaxID=8083 RepID=A0A3B5PZ32_XIPMA
MRRAVGVFFFLLTLCQGESLVCNYCYSSSSSLCQPTGTQTCSGSQNACGAVILTGAISSSFRQCMNMAVCQGFISTPGAFASCCSTNLCN